MTYPSDFEQIHLANNMHLAEKRETSELYHKALTEGSICMCSLRYFSFSRTRALRFNTKYLYNNKKKIQLLKIPERKFNFFTLFLYTVCTHALNIHTFKPVHIHTYMTEMSEQRELPRVRCPEKLFKATSALPRR